MQIKYYKAEHSSVQYETNPNSNTMQMDSWIFGTTCTKYRLIIITRILSTVCAYLAMRYVNMTTTLEFSASDIMLQTKRHFFGVKIFHSSSSHNLFAINWSWKNKQSAEFSFLDLICSFQFQLQKTCTYVGTCKHK